MKSLQLLIVFVSLTYFSFAQTIKGKVVDEKSMKPLAFVNLILSNGKGGATTDIDGNFKITIPNGEFVTVTYVGYQSKEYYPNGNLSVVIMLKSKAIEINEVVITAGENPANIIMRKLLANKKENNPEKKSYKLNSYNKTTYSATDSMTFGDLDDSASYELKAYVDTNHFLVMETVNETYFKPPNKKKETVLANKMSGFEELQFMLTPTDLQPFTMYKDLVTIFDKQYVSPICNGCIGKYFYNIEDTLYEGGDSIFVLSYQPSKGKNFEGLTGVLYVNSNKYALQYLLAEASEKEGVGASIQQQYSLINNEHWFPEQLLSTIEFYDLGLKVDSRSYIKNVELFPTFVGGTFGRIAIETATNSNEMDTVFWKENRHLQLSVKDENTYQSLEQLTDTIPLVELANYLLLLQHANGIPLGKITLPFNRFLRINDYENVRLGLGVYTNRKLSRYFSIGGYGAYGFGDEEVKYGASLEVYPSGFKSDLALIALYENDVMENGTMRFLRDRGVNPRDLLMTNVFKYENYTAALKGRFAKYAQGKLSFTRANRSIQSNYRFKKDIDNPQSVIDYTNDEVSIQLKYAYGERFSRMGEYEMSLGTKYPVVWLNYTQSITQFGGDFASQKMEASFKYSFPTVTFGQTSVLINAGKTFGDALLPSIYFGNGNFVDNFGIYQPQSFQTMGLYEFLSTEFAEIHFNHNFKNLLFGDGKFAPHLELVQSIAFGNLNNPQNHNLIEYNTLESGYFESGLLLKNVIKYRVLDTYKIGMGVGAFYRWGSYSFKNETDNFAFRTTFSVTI